MKRKTNVATTIAERAGSKRKFTIHLQFPKHDVNSLEEPLVLCKNNLGLTNQRFFFVEAKRHVAC